MQCRLGFTKTFMTEEMEKEFENILQWSRYLFRACKVQAIADRELKKESTKETGIFPNEMFILYFALLYVVLEAFKEYSFTDQRIFTLIGERYQNNIDLLRKMRNSIFHPDKSVFSSRQTDFFKESNTIMIWAYCLTDEFERYLFFYPENNQCHGKIADEIRKIIKSGNNWLPRSSLSIIKKRRLMQLEIYKNFVSKNFPENDKEFGNLTSKLLEEINKLPDSYFEEYITDSSNKLV